MADYYPLIARAIAGLDPQRSRREPVARCTRARTALIQQLRSVQPPLSRVRDHPRAAVAGRGRPQGRVRGRPARPRRLRGPAAPARQQRPPLAAPIRVRRRRPAALRREATRPTAAGRALRAWRAARNPARRAICARCAAGSAARRSLPPLPPPMPPPAAGAAAPRRPTRRRRCRRPRRACAASATSPPMPTISAVPRRRPAATRARPTPTCRRPRRNSTGSSRASENRGADPDAPYSYDESIEEAERYTPQPPQAPAARGQQDRRARAEEAAARRLGVPFKTAIAVGILLILVGTGILWRQAGSYLCQQPVQAVRRRGRGAEGRRRRRRSRRITDRVGQPSSSSEHGRAGGAARGAL